MELRGRNCLDFFAEPKQKVRTTIAEGPQAGEAKLTHTIACKREWGWFERVVGVGRDTTL